jgi:hypothetical protein
MEVLMRELGEGQLTAVTIIVWTLLASLVSIAAGAVAGMTLGGRDLGRSLAALMGALYGPLAAGPGILIGLIVLTLL